MFSLIGEQTLPFVRLHHRKGPAMPQITVYSSPFCPYCHRAKALLKKKGASFEEIDVFMQPRRKKEMIERAGGVHTVPQIFIGETHVGGCDDLYALDRKGGLDPLLTAAA